MSCSKCSGGYWECDGEGTECSGGIGRPWTTQGTVKLQIPGDGKLIVDVKARCGYNEKEDEWYPRVRLKVTGVEDPVGQTMFLGENAEVGDIQPVARQAERDLLEQFRELVELILKRFPEPPPEP